MDKLIILSICIIIFLFYKHSKSNFINQIAEQNYNNASVPTSCNFETENRPYPSGKIPGSYLGLSKQEQETLLKRFVDYKKPSDDEFAPFES